MTTIRLICRLPDATERKVIVAAANHAALVTAASNKLECPEAAVILEIKDGEELWEVDNSYWPAVQQNDTLYARTRASKRRSSGSQRIHDQDTSSTSTASASGSKRRSKSSSSAKSDGRASKRKKSSRVSDTAGDASAAEESSAGSSATATRPSTSRRDSRDSSSNKRARRSTEGLVLKEGSSSRDRYSEPVQNTAGPSTARVAVASTNPTSRKAWNLNRLAPSQLPSKRSWTAAEDTRLWDKLRLEMERRRQEHLPITTQREVFDSIVADHGTNGTKSQALRGRTADAVMARARSRVKEAVDRNLPMPPALLALFKYRTIVQPTASSRNQQRHRHQQQLIHQQQLEGNRRFGMASIMASGGASTGSSRSSSTYDQSTTATSSSSGSSTSTTTINTATPRNTVVVRDSSDEEEDAGNESEWQSDVPQPDDDEEEGSDSDENVPLTQHSHRVQRIWGGQHASSDSPSERESANGGNAWPDAPPRLLPAQPRPQSTSFSTAENARQTQLRQAALNPFAPPRVRQTGQSPSSASSSLASVADSTAGPRIAIQTVPATQSLTAIAAVASTSASAASTSTIPTPSTATIQAENTADVTLRDATAVGAGETVPAASIKQEATEERIALSREALRTPPPPLTDAVIDTTTTPSPRTRPKAEMPSETLPPASAPEHSEDELAGSHDESHEGDDHDESCHVEEHRQDQGPPRTATITGIPGALHQNLVRLEKAMSDEWADLRESVAQIVRRNVKPRSLVTSGLRLEDIYHYSAAQELKDVLDRVRQRHTPSGADLKNVQHPVTTGYAAIALTIAFEVFSSVAPPDWSVRRTSFAIAGYFGTLRKMTIATEHPHTLRRGNGVSFFLRCSEHAFWSIGSVREGSGFLEQESGDLASALTFVLGSSSQFSQHPTGSLNHSIRTLVCCLKDGPHKALEISERHGKESIVVSHRVLDVLDKIEASFKFLDRSSLPVREWGAARRLDGHKWERFAETVRRNLEDVQAACATSTSEAVKANLEGVIAAQMAIRARLQNLQNAGAMSAVSKSSERAHRANPNQRGRGSSPNRGRRPSITVSPRSPRSAVDGSRPTRPWGGPTQKQNANTSIPSMANIKSEAFDARRPLDPGPRTRGAMQQGQPAGCAPTGPRHMREPPEPRSSEPRPAGGCSLTWRPPAPLPTRDEHAVRPAGGSEGAPRGRQDVAGRSDAGHQRWN